MEFSFQLEYSNPVYQGNGIYGLVKPKENEFLKYTIGFFAGINQGLPGARYDHGNSVFVLPNYLFDT